MQCDPIFITGPVNSGKTTFLYALCSRLDSAGYRIGGVIQVIPLPNQEKTEWILSDQYTGDVRLLMTTIPQDNWDTFGRFWVDKETFSWAHERIILHMQATDYLTFDEIGPLELEGEALHATFRHALDSYHGQVVAVVRESLLDSVLHRYGIPTSKAVVLRVQSPWEEELAKVVVCE